jgi:fused signal recognition particle receptor
MVFSGLKKRLFKTSSVITGGLEGALGKGASKEEIMEALEEALITTDIGVETSLEIVEGLKGIKGKWDKETLSDNIRARLYEMIKEVEAPLSIPDAPKPYVIMVLGVNGVGKTTTIGKLALWLKDRRKSVVMGAGDTFRAAAVEQLELWGERAGCPVISQSEGTDPGAVAFDTVKSAIAKETDVVLLDTAGRA